MDKGRQVVAELRRLCPWGQVFSGDLTLVYAEDATPGLGGEAPLAVVRPGTREEVAAVVGFCAEGGFGVIPRGAGTSLSGGVVARKDAVVLALNGLSRVIEVDEANLTATAEPGVVTAQLHKMVEERGLFYPPDPGSMAVSTLGGNVAEGAGGLRGLKYGVTRDYIMGLEMVTGEGRVARFGGKTVKNVSGYDFLRLMVGSEGTLGVITEITVRLLPLPEARRAVLAVFETIDSAAAAVAGIVADKVVPATLELLDNLTIRAVEAYSACGLPTEAGAVVLIEVDGAPESVAREGERVVRACRAVGASDVRVATESGERDKIWAARRTAVSALARVRPTIFLEDATVPRSRIPEMVRAVERIAKKHDLPIGTFGHAGDGNLHPTILTDRRDPEEMKRAEAAVADIFAAALGLGGTLTGEHGIGLAKRPFMMAQFGPVGIDLLRRVKTALDPRGVLNPGKVLPPASEGGSR
ncbi:MAG TPA: FAD-linked oxidase C-terminal domain-containing protein [Bacillota bacterium]